MTVPATIRAGDTVAWVEPAALDLDGNAATSAAWTFTTFLRFNTASEAAFTDLRPGTNKGIVWQGADRQRRPWAVVYLHGFSASRLETAPLAEVVASLAARGAQAVVLGCTEIPLGILAGPHETLPVPIIDTIDALALASIAWAKG